MSFQDYSIIVMGVIILAGFVYYLWRTWPSSAPPVWAHGQVVGHVVSSRMDADGMHVTMQITSDPLMKILQGELRGLSIGPVMMDVETTGLKYHEDYDTKPLRVSAIIPQDELFLSKDEIITKAETRLRYGLEDDD